jgi:hypothetical protein
VLCAIEETKQTVVCRLVDPDERAEAATDPRTDGTDAELGTDGTD